MAHYSLRCNSMGSTTSLRFTSEIWHNIFYSCSSPTGEREPSSHPLNELCLKVLERLELNGGIWTTRGRVNCSERYKIVLYSTVLAKNATGRSLCTTDCTAGVAQLQLVQWCSDHKELNLWTKFTLIRLHWLAISVVHTLDLPQGYFETNICYMFLKMVAVMFECCQA